MSLPNDINLSTFEKMNSMKNMFGNSIIEILKPNIKTHQNESVIKMLEITKDKPETFLELLSVAIFHKNIEIIKYMVEKFKITEVDSPFMNALSFHNSIFPENSEFKLNEAKENYNLIQCPFVIMCGIGGDIEIYKYLLKNKLISNKKETGIVGLSKKIKNEFSSNIIGACCYYGRAELLEYLLKNDKYDINIQTSERKSKSGTKVGFYREYSGLTPAMLSIVGPIKDEDTVKILKILNNYNCKFKGCDFYKDNLLHLATKNKKIETAKYLVDELNLKYLLDENNKDNYNLKELINESNMIKDKNNKNNKKKKKNNEPINIDLSEYQETLKEIKTNKNKKYKYKNEKEEDDYFQSDNNINKKIKNKKYQENDDYIVGSNSDKLRALLENPKHKKKKEKKENNIYNKDLNSYENEIKGKKIAVEIKEVEVQEIKEINDTKEIKNNKNENTKHEEEDEDYIIGLGSKNKKNKKHKKNINKEEKEKEEEEKMKQKLEEERLKKEEEEKLKQKELEEEIKRKQREKELEEERKREELRKIEEEKEKERIKKLKEEEEDRKRKIKEEEEERKRREEEEIKLKKKLEEEKRKQKELEELKIKEEEKEEEKKEINEESEESDEDDYSSEKNFLSDKEVSKEKEKEKKETENYISKEDYEKLNKKYLELERRISVLEKEKEEMSNLLRNLFLQNKTNMQIPLSANKEENINDLMNLANKELENKNKIINDLQGKVSKLDLNNISKFSKDKLKQYKDFYSKNLKTINDALKQY